MDDLLHKDLIVHELHYYYLLLKICDTQVHCKHLISCQIKMSQEYKGLIFHYLLTEIEVVLILVQNEPRWHFVPSFNTSTGVET